MSNLGRIGYTVIRAAGFAAGVYYIKFDAELTNSTYVISLAKEESGTIKIWDSSRPTVAGFHVVTSNTSVTLTDSIFHFTVFT